MTRNINSLSVLTDGPWQYFTPHLMYQYAYVDTTPRAPLTANDYNLVIRQQPKEALVALEGKEKQRKPVDPPPIVQVQVRNSSDPRQQFLQSPYLFMCVSLWSASKAEPQATEACRSLAGSLVSSLHRLKDIDNNDGGFFVFGDISVKIPGEHRLSFSLFELRKGSNSERDVGEVTYLKSIISDPFKVLQQKDFRGLEESTYLSRAFSDQGVRLRLRKEPRGLLSSKRAFMYGVPQPIPPPPPPPESVVPATPTHHVASNYDNHPYSEEASPTGGNSVKRIRQSIEFGNVNQGDGRSPIFYDQRSPIVTDNAGYHSRHHSLYSNNAPGSHPVRTPSLSSFAHAVNHGGPSNISSYYPHMTQPTPPGSFAFRQHQHQQHQHCLQQQPTTPSTAATTATSSYMIDALAAAATSQIPRERYQESTPSTLESPIYDQAYNHKHDGDLQGNASGVIHTTNASIVSVSAATAATAATAADMASAYTSPLPPPPPPVPQSQHSQGSQRSQLSSYSGHSHQSYYSPSLTDVQYGMESLNPHGGETSVVGRDVKQMQACMGES